MNSESTVRQRLARRLLPGVAVVGLIASGALAASDGVIPEFQASYKVRASIASGELSMSLAALEDGKYLFATLTRPRGLVRVIARGEIDERSHVRFEGNTVVPLDYVLLDTISDDHDANYQYDWAAGEVTGVERGAEVSGTLQPGMLNRAALYLAIMADLRNDALPESYTLFDRGQVKSFNITNAGSETVEVPHGRFETVKLVRDSDGSSRSMILWCAPALGYLPVKIELMKGDKRISRAELKWVQGLPAPATAEHPAATD